MAELDRSRIEKAYEALQKYIDAQNNKSDDSNVKKQLFNDGSDLDREPVFISVHATKYFADTRKLRPIIIKTPHRIYPGDVRVCLVAQDPEKDTNVALVDEDEESYKVAELKKVVGISKFVKGEYRPYEARRALVKEFDVFVCDQAVFQLVPQHLGKAFYKKNRVPVPIRTRDKDKKVSAERVASEISRILGSTLVTPTAGPNLTIQVGNRKHSSKEIAENVVEIVKGLEDKGIINAKTRVRNVYLKATDSPALPIYLADKLSSEQDTVVDNGDDSGTKRKRDEKEPSDGHRLSRIERLLADVVDDETLQKLADRRKNKKAKKSAKNARSSKNGSDQEAPVDGASASESEDDFSSEPDDSDDE
jgi:ribosome biogenesis protein UTP30